MNHIWQVLKEQLFNFNLIIRLAFYEVKSKYKMHYLGAFWQILNPFILIGIYWFVFGLGIRGGSPVGETPFFLWLITALVPWFFISSTIIQGSSSIYTKVSLVSKMKFPVSVLPSIQIIANSFSFIFMLLFTIGVLLLNDVYSGLYILQLPYYLFSLYFLLFGLTILLSTITIIIRDIQSLVQSFMRVIMYMLPILWNVNTLPDLLVTILKLNPFFYIIEGFRHTLLGGEWFFNDLPQTLYFWLISILLLFIGSTVHLKFRHKFVDYI
ncbi:Teichoic acid translocation permease TagG [Sporosarcina globispora]|uniref:Transport permease protein n=1 Tax=Sporosarcina globispora TaxID=1459 RepID=A0A0M0G8T3_SPOGL|nr:ABC transporter permease [Sporosarcina globispora]KON86249.1 Teichoic acid translocation permease TagG [Sporosarcina globispora]